MARSTDNAAQRRHPPSRYRDYRPTGESTLWVFIGGGLLAANAGYVNIIILGLLGQPVSHVTGPLSRVTLDLGATQHFAGLGPIIAVVGAFALGALVSGMLTGNEILSHNRTYSVALILESLMLASATLLGLRGMSAAAPVAACACGLQNALATTFRGVIIRTTHITGVVTDIAVVLGHKLRRKRLYPYKLALLVLLLTGFLSGGLAGATAYRALGVAALSLASGACLLYGLLYYAYTLRVGFNSERDEFPERRR